MLWAVATLGHADTSFVAALTTAAQPKLRGFNAQAISNTLWAVATLRHVDPSFTSALLATAHPRLHDFSEQALANIMWAMATLGHLDATFTSALLSAAQQPKLHHFNPQATVSMLWALAKMGHVDPSFIAALLSAADPKLPEVTCQGLSTMAWALAILDHRDTPSLRTVLRHLARLRHELIPEQELQLFQFFLHLKDRGLPHGDEPPHLQQLFGGGPPHLQQLPRSDESAHLQQLFLRCQTSWLRVLKVSQCASSSSFQDEVLVACCQQPGWQVLGGEHPTEDGLFSIDIAMVQQGEVSSRVSRKSCDGSARKQVAVEADGPTHFSSNSPAVVLGDTLARNRFLTHRGWRVLSVPWFEWRSLGDDEQRVAYMGQRLLQVLNST